MRFLIREKIFSFGDSFTIKDEMGSDRYLVRGKVFSFGDKLRIYDMPGNEIVYIEQKLFKLLPEYDVYLYGRYAAKIKREFTLFTKKFNIESSMGSYTVDGDFLGLDFVIKRDGYISAVVSKKFFSFSDTYGVDIRDDENEALMLALTIVIDQVVHDNERR
jgi:uncharacterized protein YxjI